MHHGYGAHHPDRNADLLPIATSIGIDPIQFGIMVILNCGIGLSEHLLWARCCLSDPRYPRRDGTVVKATLPFYLCMIITLMLITFVPAFSYVAAHG